MSFLIDNPLKRVQIECLIAFAHSRITGLAGKDQQGTEIFNSDNVLKDAIESGNELSKVLEELATVETINKKISNVNNIGLSNMYHHHYTKLLNLLDNAIPKDGFMIEGLIGLHLLRLASLKGALNSDNLDYYNYVIGLYENDTYSNDEVVKKTVCFMREISESIFNKFWLKDKRGRTKKSLVSHKEMKETKAFKDLQKQQSKEDKKLKVKSK